ncbi:MAG TPA: bifunctional proline dehydrogenase/L-glutamate gamma-semialdehyde dehydrogenase PutA [Casimicrobiaceae bacterium]|nr:bifunctional proline dehydrogenase/L-glutamate gamma-semialdehyde dehydrogenase PutA [Casimicrobiaceae bacterium]
MKTDALSPYRFSDPQTPLREAITRATRIAEPVAVANCVTDATLDRGQRKRACALALDLARKVRATRREARGADALIQTFDLSSDEGIALMCLAEALLRIPDADTADALIRDKIGRGDWRAYAGGSESLFVNAACWGLVVTGKLVASPPDANRLARALTESLSRVGEPVIRGAMRAAMRFLGEQFVLGESIGAAIERAADREACGYRYSYDMLGEAALTAADANRYEQAYVDALHAIGAAAARRGVVQGPGLSVKLSALHPRYVRSQRDRVLRELLPRVAALATLAKHYDVGLNIDAEEADRLELSLDLIEALARDRELAAWEGLGVVVQAYQKRAPLVLDWTIALARDTGRRMMVRLVKGAYWDSEIKRAQVDGLADYPVYTRKVHTDLAYLACARKLLANRDVTFPQFATHNAATLAAVLEIAGDRHGFEFQCLHGMGEPLYDHVVGAANLELPCRIYAPVGSHETLLAYLVRRLLENGANTSFVNQVADERVDLDRLVADPVTEARAFNGAPHPRIPLPSMIYPDRRNSAGLDLADERALALLQHELQSVASRDYAAWPLLANQTARDRSARPSRSPADDAIQVGSITEADATDVETALTSACNEGRAWGRVHAVERAAILERAADLIESRRETFMHLAIREAGKTLPNAVGEVREAIDFCRYYARQLRTQGPAPPLGTIVAISPWNFPLAIFVGQVAGALAAGNAVIAKPAEQTPLIAHEAVQAMHDAGVPRTALQCLPGPGETVGAHLVADARVDGVVFTGSTHVATLIHRTLAKRGNLPLIAETGGQNAMIVDASALAEQVVNDVIGSAFDSAGQRCSALRVLCLQEDIADRVIAMLGGAMAELRVGDPAALSTDIGPIIDANAKRMLEAHVQRMSREAKRIAGTPLPGSVRGHFVAPVAFEIDSLSVLTSEVFGPVLHVLRYDSNNLDELIDDLNATGYALTLGIHSRIDAVVDRIVERTRAGNVYVNRNIVGAVVGVQPFGGEGLSGTGPKAGGPLYVNRLTSDPGEAVLGTVELPGPTGERNTLRLVPRGKLIGVGGDREEQQRVAWTTGNAIVFADEVGANWSRLDGIAGAIAADSMSAAEANRFMAARDGARLPVIEPVGDPPRYPTTRLVIERTLTVNTTAAGGNASLVAAID